MVQLSRLRRVEKGRGDNKDMSANSMKAKPLYIN